MNNNKELKDNEFKNADFLDDTEKIADFKILTKEQFLESYNYLTEEEYNNTVDKLYDLFVEET